MSNQPARATCMDCQDAYDIVQLCPLHAAAPQLYEALKQIALTTYGDAPVIATAALALVDQSKEIGLMSTQLTLKASPPFVAQSARDSFKKESSFTLVTLDIEGDGPKHHAAVMVWGDGADVAARRGRTIMETVNAHDALVARLKKLEAGLAQLANNNLSQENCASVEVAAKRVRNIAALALTQSEVKS